MVLQPPEVELPVGDPLVGGKAVQLGCVGVVPRDPVLFAYISPRQHWPPACHWSAASRHNRASVKSC